MKVEDALKAIDGEGVSLSDCSIGELLQLAMGACLTDDGDIWCCICNKPNECCTCSLDKYEEIF